MSLDPNRCWQAVISRDATEDCAFYYGVITTGVFCRPGCAARQPRRENVRFYATAAEAQKDGLRACRRCRPLALTGSDPLTERIRELCEYMDQNYRSAPSLGDLAARAGVSPFHLQRAFNPG